MDKKKQLEEIIAGLGTLAETSLIFYRTILGAGGTMEEAFRLTQAYIAASLYGNKKDGQEADNKT